MSCQAELTEIVLFVDTNLAIPTEVETLEVQIGSPSGRAFTETVDLRQNVDLPASLSLTSRSGPVGPVFIRVAALKLQEEVVTRELETSFLDGQRLEISLSLDRSCRVVCCPDDTTCDQGQCVDIERDAAEFPRFSGSAPPRFSEQGCNEPTAEQCNGIDDDCDELVDEEFDLLTDPDNCGSCGRECTGGGFCDDGRCAGEEISEVAAGQSHTCAVRSDGSSIPGSVVCWGDNMFGQLGHSNGVSSRFPGVVGALFRVQKLAAGSRHTCALLADGDLLCWGDNGAGQSDPADNGAIIRSPLTILRGVLDVATGEEHSCAIRQGGQALCWGNNDSGQLGTGDTRRVVEPTGVMMPESAISIAAGSRHSCAVGESGRVWCWGANDFGQGGVGNNVQQVLVPEQVTREDGQGFDGALEVKAATDYTCSRQQDESLHCWGSNRFGQLGNTEGADPDVNAARSYPERILFANAPGVVDFDIAAPEGGHGCAQLRVDSGMVRCWGAGRFGQLGDTTRVESRNEPVVVATLPNGVPLGPVAVGGEHSCSVVNGSDVYCWGKNDAGQLGLGKSSEAEPSAVPVQCIFEGGFR